LARAAALESSTFDPEPDAAELSRDPGVLAAFADLRSRASIRLSPGSDVRIESRAAVRGREIVMEEHVVNSSWPDGLRYLRGVDLVALLRLAPHHSDVGDLFEANRPNAPNVELPDFLGALSVLVAKSALRHG
jgi:hypothetical protein